MLKAAPFGGERELNWAKRMGDNVLLDSPPHHDHDDDHDLDLQ